KEETATASKKDDDDDAKDKSDAPKKSIFEVAGSQPPKPSAKVPDDKATKESKGPKSPLFSVDGPESVESEKKETPRASTATDPASSKSKGESIFGVAEPKSKKTDTDASETKTAPFSGAPKTPYTPSTEKFDTGRVVDVASVSTPDDVYDYVEEDTDTSKETSGKAKKDDKDAGEKKAAPAKPVSVDELWELTTIDADVVTKSSTPTASKKTDEKSKKEKAVIYDNTGDGDDGFDNYYGNPPEGDFIDDEEEEDFDFAFAPRPGDSDYYDDYDDEWDEEGDWDGTYADDDEFVGEYEEDGEFVEEEDDLDTESGFEEGEIEETEEEIYDGEKEEIYDEYDEGEYDDDDYWEDEEEGDVEDGYWEDPPMSDSYDDGEYDDDEDWEEEDEWDDTYAGDDDTNVEGPFVVSDPPQAPQNFGSAVAAAANAKTGGPIPDNSFMSADVQKQISQNPNMNIVSTPSTPSPSRQSPLNSPDVQSLAKKSDMMGSVNTGAMMTPRVVRKSPAPQSQSAPQASTAPQNQSQGNLAQSPQPPPTPQQKHFQVSAGTTPESFGSAVQLAAAGLSDAIGNSGAQRYQQEQEAKKDKSMVDDVAMKFYKRTWNVAPPE
ncbi:MAG: hypothetical protein SGARI_002234, partial [Bacillariaceae sp.]